MEDKEGYNTSPKFQDGASRTPNINPDVLSGAGKKKRKRYSVNEYVEEILSGNRTISARPLPWLKVPCRSIIKRRRQS